MVNKRMKQKKNTSYDLSLLFKLKFQMREKKKKKNEVYTSNIIQYVTRNQRTGTTHNTTEHITQTKINKTQ